MFNYVVLIYKVVLNCCYRQVFIWYVSVRCSFVHRSLKFGAMIFSGPVAFFFGPVTFQIYWPPGPVASEAYCGGLCMYNNNIYM